MRVEKKRYNTCQKCGVDKNETTYPWCTNCYKGSRRKRIYTHCEKCKIEKKENSYAYCRNCARKINIANKARKISKENLNDKILILFNKLEKMKYQVTIVEMFEIVDLWDQISKNSQKYDCYNPDTQLNKMLLDLIKYKRSIEKNKKSFLELNIYTKK